MPHQCMTIPNNSRTRTPSGHLQYYVISEALPGAHVHHLSAYDVLISTTKKFAFVFLDYMTGLLPARSDVQVLFERELLAPAALISYTFSTQRISEGELDDFESWHGVHAVCSGRAATRLASFRHSHMVCLVYYVIVENIRATSRPLGTAEATLSSLRASTMMRPGCATLPATRSLSSNDSSVRISKSL